MKRIVAALALAVAATAVTVTTPPAVASLTGTYTGWHYRNPEICIKTNGWVRWPWADVAAQWNRAGASRVHVVASSTCTGYDLTQVIQTAAYRTTSRVCAITDPGPVMYGGGGVYRMTIRLNIDPAGSAGCLSTAFQLKHVAMHEAGHALGLGHPDYCASIMGPGSACGWRYAVPTSYDIRNIQALYDAAKRQATSSVLVPNKTTIQ